MPKYEPVLLGEANEVSAPKEAIKGTRHAFFGVQGGVDATVYERDTLPLGATFEGPAIVEQFELNYRAASRLARENRWVSKFNFKSGRSVK